MQLGFSKQISENLLDDFFDLVVENLIKEKKLKLSKFGTFLFSRLEGIYEGFLSIIKR